jgi:hypothetical protein
MASMAYCEQVGVKRQAGGNRGEIRSWYVLIKKRKKLVPHFCRKFFINPFFLHQKFPAKILFLNC